ncbi:MAG: UDP-N-acetylglucosamine 2-epimerase (non-hydrolyzing) [Deltaproteobacteria bacterium]|nr:UDP-N-acetylglucosamine 2-epimerase (non-hydrolyzing) [Deltaproteobacteria bacterium]
MQPLSVMVIVGTRPEVIKMAPVVRALARRPERFAVELCVVGQQGAVLEQSLDEWGLRPTVRVDLPSFDRGLGATLSAILAAVAGHLADRRPGLVLVQGDTTTTLGASLAAFYAQIPLGHVEAGLRTGDLTQPFPEEAHRVLTDRLAAVHYAPTAQARANLLAEGCADGSIVVVGNTVIDALRAVDVAAAAPPRDGRRRVLVTCHRRENFGDGVRGLCEALRRVTAARDDVEVDYVLHPHPGASEPVRALLEGAPRVRLLDPMGHREFVALLASAWLVVTDSGGVQEEAAALGRPLLVTRRSTERPEAVEDGAARVVGTRAEDLVDAISTLLESPVSYERMSRPVDALGDGHAARRIADDLHARFGGPRCP